MTTVQRRKRCEPGCACGRHRKRTQVHPEECMCATHGGRVVQTGYTTRCEEGCTCARHRGSTYTPEHVTEAAQAKQERKQAARTARVANDPVFVKSERKRRREYAAFKQQTDPAWVQRNKDRSKAHGRRYALKHKFGLTLADWDARLIAQSGRCYLCEEPMRPEDIHVDHDRSCCAGSKSCGQCVRGLACRWCNQGCGQFRDDPDRMIRVAENLRTALSVRS